MTLEHDLGVISIWKVDPVGGEFVEWPATPEDACITCEAELLEFLHSQDPQHVTWRNPQSTASKSGFVWVPHDRLAPLIAEIDFLSRQTIASERAIDALAKLRAACQFACEIDDAGVCVT